MNRKVFKAPNIAQAMADIKEELGPDAMILNTRKIGRKPLDPYGRALFEVEAAAPENQARRPGIGQTDRLNPTRTAAVRDKASGLPGWDRSGSRTRVEPARADTAMDRAFPADGQVLKRLQDDIADIKDLISIAGFGSGMKNMVCNHFESVGVLASLLRAGISEPLAADIVRTACNRMEQSPEAGDRIRSLKKYVMKECLSRINSRDYFTRDNQSGLPHAAAFVGPTGVGKTTTLAKLAARLSFTRKMKVGLVSIDNYRVGAFEQLKAYAGIMGLPCVPAFTSQDLACALDRMRAMDMVLIDTAGHSHTDRARIDEILGLLKGDFRISTHLVLSVTSESIIMKDAASAFSAFKPDTAVFTKIDETKRCGKILDQVSGMKLPVSLVTNGQRVPEDLIVPDKRDLLKIILGTRS